MTKSKYYEAMIEILDEEFPKGLCKERGKALLMLAKIEILLELENKIK
jgi:hypothetical protein